MIEGNLFTDKGRHRAGFLSDYPHSLGAVAFMPTVLISFHLLTPKQLYAILNEHSGIVVNQHNFVFFLFLILMIKESYLYVSYT